MAELTNNGSLGTSSAGSVGGHVELETTADAANVERAAAARPCELAQADPVPPLQRGHLPAAPEQEIQQAGDEQHHATLEMKSFIPAKPIGPSIYFSDKRIPPSFIPASTRVLPLVIQIEASQHPLNSSSIFNSKRLHSLYLLPLQRRPLNYVSYTQIPILDIFFIFLYTYLSYSNALYIF